MIHCDFPYHCSLCRNLYFIDSWSLIKFRFHFNQSFQGPHALAPLEMISTISTTEAARKVWGLWWWDFVFCVFFFPAFFCFFWRSCFSFGQFNFFQFHRWIVWFLLLLNLCDSHLNLRGGGHPQPLVGLLKFSWVKLACFGSSPML